MADNASTPATNASTSQQEVDALLAMVSSLLKMSLDLTRVCVEVQGNRRLVYSSTPMLTLRLAVVPGVALSKQALQLTGLCLDIKDQIRHTFAVVEAAVAAATPTVPPPAPLTPNQLEASHPQGICDDLAWQVVCIGREPGMFISAHSLIKSFLATRPVPTYLVSPMDIARRRTLAFYRARYADHKVHKFREVPIDAAQPATDSDSEPAATDSAPALDHSAPAITDSDSVVNIDSDATDEELGGWVAGDVSLVKVKSVAA
ncbi:hypothetical protein C8R43DRAFT_944830 [Mycena crocata]|nr:hypothetical protein C8R43DRAFT_944830 [Mycena crocata]